MMLGINKVIHVADNKHYYSHLGDTMPLMFLHYYTSEKVKITSKVSIGISSFPTQKEAVYYANVAEILTT